MSFTDAEIIIDGFKNRKIVGEKPFIIGPVDNIRYDLNIETMQKSPGYSIIFKITNLLWKDPDNIYTASNILSKWKKTIIKMTTNAKEFDNILDSEDLERYSQKDTDDIKYVMTIYDNARNIDGLSPEKNSYNVYSKNSLTVKYSITCNSNETIPEKMNVYLGIFSIDENDMFNRKIVKLSYDKVVKESNVKTYGFHLREDVTDPDDMIEYLYDNKNFKRVNMVMIGEARQIQFNYNEWENAFFLPKSCMLNDSGNIVYYINNNDEDKKIDGTPSDISNPNYKGNVMMRWSNDNKPFYWSYVPDTDGRGGVFTISTHKLNDTMEAWNFYDKWGDLRNEFFTSKFLLRKIGENYRSLDVDISESNFNMLNDEEERKAFNISTYIPDSFCNYQLIILLLMMLCKSVNIPKHFGCGYTNFKDTNYVKLREAQKSFRTSGLFAGTVINDYYHGNRALAEKIKSYGVKIFGMYNWYGLIPRRISGILMSESGLVGKLCYGYKDGSTTFSRNSYTPEGMYLISKGVYKYDNVESRINDVFSASDEYIERMHHSKFGITPFFKEYDDMISKASSSTYYCEISRFYFIAPYSKEFLRDNNKFRDNPVYYGNSIEVSSDESIDYLTALKETTVFLRNDLPYNKVFYNGMSR